MAISLELENYLLDLVKKNYEEIAVEFDLTRRKELWPKMYQWAEMVPENSRVLDIGCGNGRLLEAFKNKKIDYLGLDNSQSLLEKARERYAGKKFLFGDILNLPNLGEALFPTVFCLAVLQHFPGQTLRLKALKQLKSKMSPEGRLFISVWNLWKNSKYRPLLFKSYCLKILGKNRLGFNDLVFPWKDSRGVAKSKRYYHAFTKREMGKLFRLAGLQIESLERDQYNYWYILKIKK